ncbi:MAG: 2-hydroxychromene-2-carboxylate isomerase [SAR324 cluster bacterium]|nr:2-hydroxychromene-2-carboxylate isomerase [SAR324 cluster bacterium]
MSNTTVRFLFDYNSPYSYLASLQVEEVCQRHGAKMHWVPIVLGGIFKEDNTTPAHMIDKRREYMLKDLETLAEMYGLPYQARSNFLFNPILAMRTTLQVPQGEERARAVHGLYRGAFAEDLDLGDPEVVTRFLNKSGLDGPALVDGSQQQWVKDELKKNTDDALAQGVFGAPTFILSDGRMLWGHDRLKVLDYFLEKPKNG